MYAYNDIVSDLSERASERASIKTATIAISATTGVSWEGEYVSFLARHCPFCSSASPRNTLEPLRWSDDVRGDVLIVLDIDARPSDRRVLLARKLRPSEEIQKQQRPQFPVRKHCRQLSGWAHLTVRTLLSRSAVTPVVVITLGIPCDDRMACSGDVFIVVNICVRPNAVMFHTTNERASKYENGNCRNFRYDDTAVSWRSEYISL